MCRASPTKSMHFTVLVMMLNLTNVPAIYNVGNKLVQQPQMPNSFNNQKYSTDVSYTVPKGSPEELQQLQNFKPSPVVDFTLADAKIANSIDSGSVKSSSTKIYNSNKYIDSAETNSYNNRRDSSKGTDNQFSFPYEIQGQYNQQIPQHTTGLSVHTYKDPYTNENYYYSPVENKETEAYNHNYFSNDGQEYLVQSSMLVGSQQKQPYQQSVSSNYQYLNNNNNNNKDVYEKRPGQVYDEKAVYSSPNVVRESESEEASKISYDSHDYPPPSYSQHQTSNFLPTPIPENPNRRPTPAKLPENPNRRPAPLTITENPNRRPVPTPPSFVIQNTRPQSSLAHYNNQQQGQYQQTPQYTYTHAPQSSIPNYESPFNNYLPNSQYSGYYTTPSYNEQQQYQVNLRPPPPYAQNGNYQYRPTYAKPPPNRPEDYQIGEIPSYGFQNPHQSSLTHQRPISGSTNPQHGSLAMLAQYAPQLTSLFLGGGGNGAETNSNNPLSSLLGVFTGGTTQQKPPAYTSSNNRRPVNSQLIRALENIARNDDLQCVPKVLCQMIATQTQRGQLPSFITSPAITNFLGNFPTTSPALIYGRAALLGLSGGDKICHNTYTKCPKNEYEIIYYLNNHRGGFFKFFSEPEPEQHYMQQQQHNGNQEQAGSTFLNILNALTGNSDVTPTTTTKPVSQPADITSGISSFFTQLLSNYMGDVQYQRRRRRSLQRLDDDHEKSIKFQENDSDDYDALSGIEVDENFHDEEDSEDTKYADEFQNKSKDKILFPESDSNKDENLEKIIKKFNDSNKSKKLTFPREDNLHPPIDSRPAQTYSSTNKITFDNDKGQTLTGNHWVPDRKERILNRPQDFDATYPYYQQNDQFNNDEDKLVLSNNKRPASNSYRYDNPSNNYNSFTTSLSSHTQYLQSVMQNNYYDTSPSSLNGGSNFFLPTPAPEQTNLSNDNNLHNNDYHSFYQTYSYNSPNNNRPQLPNIPKSDNKNIYVTNSQGKTEYYITEDGRKVYL